MSIRASGKADLAVQANEAPKGNRIGPDRWVLDTFLGRGDGTFRSKESALLNSISAYGLEIAVAGFNGDGEPDVLSSGRSGCDVLVGSKPVLQLGRGDG